jgi:hypothetical protein
MLLMMAAEYFVWGIDEREGDYMRPVFGDVYVTQARKMFAFARERGYLN